MSFSNYKGNQINKSNFGAICYQLSVFVVGTIIYIRNLHYFDKCCQNFAGKTWFTLYSRYIWSLHARLFLFCRLHVEFSHDIFWSLAVLPALYVVLKRLKTNGEYLGSVVVEDHKASSFLLRGCISTVPARKLH